MNNNEQEFLRKLKREIKDSRIEPDKDSLFNPCLFGKVDGVEVSGTTSNSPVSSSDICQRGLFE